VGCVNELCLGGVVAFSVSGQFRAGRGVRESIGVELPAGYGYVVAFSAVGLAFVVIGLLLSRAVRPGRAVPQKFITYECGPDPLMPSWHMFNPRYYVYALLFVLFDVEAVFLFPWALVFKKFSVAGVIDMVIFVAILTLGLLYAWRKGALEWE
jgi:NADH:ubiquinone oxidoreductase subunit 3 (subunit A)